MRFHRMGNTGKEMIESGAWVRVERKHYRHENGAEIKYNHNAWRWDVIVAGTVIEAYTTLWAARHVAERWIEMRMVGGAR